jgi:hypothetical protein
MALRRDVDFRMILRPRDISPRIAMTANLRFKPSRKGRKKSAEEEVKDSELKVDSEMRAELDDSDEEIDPECLAMATRNIMVTYPDTEERVRWD